MDERESRRAEQEARREMRDRPVRPGQDPIARYLAAEAYAEGHPHTKAPESEEPPR
jgi:hypothetical protein